MNLFQYKDYYLQNLFRKIGFMSQISHEVTTGTSIYLISEAIGCLLPQCFSSLGVCVGYWGVRTVFCIKLATHFYFGEWRYQVNLELIFFVLEKNTDCSAEKV